MIELEKDDSSENDWKKERAKKDKKNFQEHKLKEFSQDIQTRLKDVKSEPMVKKAVNSYIGSGYKISNPLLRKYGNDNNNIAKLENV